MAIIGSILGDIAGSVYEFSRPEDLDYKSIALFTDNTFFTDDTVLLIATKYALDNDRDFGSAYHTFGRDYRNCNWGTSFYNWIRKREIQPPYNSFGNGSAMRVSPVVDYVDNEKELLELAKETAICTHNHPEGVKGACVTAMCTYMAKTGASKNEILKYAMKFYNCGDYKYPVSMKLSQMREDYKWDETCQGSVPLAIRCFLEADSYEEYLRNVMSVKCDTDTIGAIGGGMAEEFFGETGFEDRKLLKYYLDDKLYEIVAGMIKE